MTFQFKPGNRYVLGGAMAAKLINMHPALRDNDALARLVGGRKPPRLVVRVASTGFAALTATWNVSPAKRDGVARLTKLVVVLEGIDLR